VVDDLMNLKQGWSEASFDEVNMKLG